MTCLEDRVIQGVYFLSGRLLALSIWFLKLQACRLILQRKHGK
jgi:hypothetical protein